MSGATREGRTAQDLEWNAALAGLIRGVEQAKGTIARVEDAVERVRVAGQFGCADQPRSFADLSPEIRARVALRWLRDAVQHKGGTPVDEMLEYTDDLERAFEDLVRDASMSRRAASSSVVYQGWRKVAGLYRCPEHVRKVWVA